MNIKTIFHWIAWWLRCFFFILIYPISTESTQRVLRVGRGCTLLCGTWPYLYFRSVFAMPLLGIFVFGSLILNTVRNHQVIYDILNVLSFTCTKQIDAKFIYMKIYIQYIYCKLFVFKIADIRLKVLHKNSMNVKKNMRLTKIFILKKQWMRIA